MRWRNGFVRETACFEKLFVSITLALALALLYGLFFMKLGEPSRSLECNETISGKVCQTRYPGGTR